jgi:radical SAM-linked protein
MLSEGKKLTEKKRLRSLPVIQPPITVRLMFRKIGTLQYISHLDLQRTLLRVINRACIPVWYTKGFNPHAKLVFSTPLSVGAQSEYEFLDIRIDREMSCEEIMTRLNGELTEELCITDAYIPTTDFHDIAWASYNIEIHTAGADGSMADEIKKILSTSPLNLIKKTKAGEKEIDITTLIRSAEVGFDETSEAITIKTVLSATTNEFLNPEMIITGLKQKLNILSSDPINEHYSIMRTGIMFADMTLFR